MTIKKKELKTFEEIFEENKRLVSIRENSIKTGVKDRYGIDIRELDIILFEKYTDFGYVSASCEVKKNRKGEYCLVSTNPLAGFVPVKLSEVKSKYLDVNIVKTKKKIKENLDK